ncbi:MAG: hypothetical protein WD075_04340 [Rhodospirillales bacterium]
MKRPRCALMIYFFTVLLVFLVVGRANAIPPELPPNVMDEASWPSSLRSAYKEYREAIDDYAREDWSAMAPKSASKLQNVIDDAISEFGDTNPSVGLLEMEMLYFLLNSDPKDTDSIVEHSWRAVKALRTQDGKLTAELNIVLPNIAFTLIRHGRLFEGEAFLREIVQNGAPYFLANDIRFLLSGMPKQDELEWTLKSTDATQKYKLDLLVLKSAATILESDQLLKYVTDRMAKFEQ